MTAKPLSKLLNLSENGELGDIVERAREMGELTETLSKSLPSELAGSIVAANLRDDSELVLICSSSAWAARLRYEEAAILQSARSIGLDVDKVSVRVARVDYNAND